MFQNWSMVFVYIFSGALYNKQEFKECFYHTNSVLLGPGTLNTHLIQNQVHSFVTKMVM